MLQRVRFSTIQIANNPNVRVIFILSTLVLAALLGGAPHDMGGG